MLLLIPMSIEWIPNIPFADKVVHFLLFAYITYVASRVFPLWMAALFALTLGFGTEFAQSLTTWRSGDFFDLYADAAGVVAAYCVLRIFSTNRNCTDECCETD